MLTRLPMVASVLRSFYPFRASKRTSCVWSGSVGLLVVSAAMGLNAEISLDMEWVWRLMSVLLLSGVFWPLESAEAEDVEAENAEAEDVEASDVPEAPRTRHFPSQALDHVSSGLLVLDNAYRVLHFNRAVHDFFPQATIARGEPLPHDLAERLPASGGHTLFAWPPGSGTMVQLEAHAVRNDDKTGWILSLRDVTDIVRTEETLENTDRLLHAILRTSVTAVAVVDEQGRITYANRRAEDILGLHRSGSDAWRFEQLGWTMTPVDPDARFSHTPLRDVLETGTPIRGARYAITWPDGTRKYLSLHAAPLPETARRSRQVVFSVEDITERHRTQQRLQKERSLFEAAINSLPGIFYMVDHDGRHRRWNETFEQATGYSSDELAGRALPDLFDPGDRTRIRRSVQEVFPSGNGFSVEADLVSKDGARTPYVFTGAGVSIDGTDYLIGVGLDVSTQKRREEELRRAKTEADLARRDAEEARAEAEQMNELKSAFLANMSHEIRTPLTSIIGFADVLLQEDDPPRSFARHIARGGRRLLDTLDALLELSKLEAGVRALTQSPIDVKAAVQKAIDRFAEDIEQKDLDLSITLPESSCTARLDALAFKRVCEHLLSNAIKFTHEGDRVMLHLHDEPSGLRFVVADTGIGIPRDVQPRIFEPFVQASSGLSREHEGNGLGLSITKGLLELMEGQITLDSVEGRGTTVTVRLPKGTVDGADAPPPSSRLSDA